MTIKPNNTILKELIWVSRVASEIALQALHPGAGNLLHDERVAAVRDELVFRIVPIYTRYALPHAIFRLAGHDPTEYMMQVQSDDTLEILRVKEKLRYIVVDYDTEHKSTADTEKEKTFELPDGNFITVGVKRFHCMKVFFQSNFIVEGTSGIHDSPLQYNMNCDVDLLKNLHAVTLSHVV